MAFATLGGFAFSPSNEKMFIQKNQYQKLFPVATLVLSPHSNAHFLLCTSHKGEKGMFKAKNNKNIPPNEAPSSPKPQQLMQTSRQSITKPFIPLKKPYQILPSTLIWIFFPALFSFRSPLASLHIHQPRLLRLGTQVTLSSWTL